MDQDTEAAGMDCLERGVVMVGMVQLLEQLFRLDSPVGVACPPDFDFVPGGVQPLDVEELSEAAGLEPLLAERCVVHPVLRVPVFGMFHVRPVRVDEDVDCGDPLGDGELELRARRVRVGRDERAHGSADGPADNGGDDHDGANPPEPLSRAHARDEFWKHGHSGAVAYPTRAPRG